MDQKIVIPKPHTPKQDIIMRCFFIPGLLELWVSCGTKFGKTLGGISGISAKAWVTKNGIFRWTAPIYSQVKYGYRYAKKIFPGEPHVKLNESGPYITIPKTDTMLEFRSAKNPEDLEGEGSAGTGLDEAAKMVRQAYDSIKTTHTRTGALIAGFSTPRGKNWFHEKCMESKDIMEWCLKNNKPPTHIFLTARTIDNPFIRPEAVDEARRSLPDRLFRQYYLAEFVDDGTVFVGTRECIQNPENELELFGRVQRWIHSDAKQRNVVIGVDWAKSEDYTVFYALDYEKKPYETVGIMRFQGINYTQAVKELVLFARSFKKAELVKHDKTGIGGVLEDLLGATPLAFEGYVFSNTSKSYIINNLILGFERRTLTIPNWTTLLQELDSYEVHVSEAGNMKYSAPSGMHDDLVIGLALALSAAEEFSTKAMNLRFLEDLPNTKLSMDDYYNDMIEDTDQLSNQIFGFNINDD